MTPFDDEEIMRLANNLASWASWKYMDRIRNYDRQDIRQEAWVAMLVNKVKPEGKAWRDHLMNVIKSHLYELCRKEKRRAEKCRQAPEPPEDLGVDVPARETLTIDELLPFSLPPADRLMLNVKHCEGRSLEVIAARLNGQGYRTATGLPFSAETVRKRLRDLHRSLALPLAPLRHFGNLRDSVPFL